MFITIGRRQINSDTIKTLKSNGDFQCILEISGGKHTTVGDSLADVMNVLSVDAPHLSFTSIKEGNTQKLLCINQMQEYVVDDKDESRCIVTFKDGDYQRVNTNKATLDVLAAGLFRLGQGVGGQDGASTSWRGELPAPPSSPEDGWIYKSSVDGNTYVYVEFSKTWEIMAFNDAQGAEGTPLVTYYTWVKFADDINGTNLSNFPEDKDYIGIARNKLDKLESFNPIDYEWSLFKTDQGLVDDDNFIWMKFADDTDGSNLTDDPTSKDFVGVAYGNATQTESLDPSDYTWQEYRDSYGISGPEGLTLYITYNDTPIHSLPDTPTGNGNLDGWHTAFTPAASWMSQKTEPNVETGTWSEPTALFEADGTEGAPAIYLELDSNGGTFFTKAPGTDGTSSSHWPQSGAFILTGTSNEDITWSSSGLSSDLSGVGTAKTVYAVADAGDPYITNIYATITATTDSGLAKTLTIRKIDTSDGTYIDENGVYTGSITADQIRVGASWDTLPADSADVTVDTFETGFQGDTGGITLGTDAAINTSGKTSFDSATPGIWMGAVAGVGMMGIGNDTNYIKWDGSTMTIRGGLNADDIDAGTISADLVTGGTLDFNNVIADNLTVTKLTATPGGQGIAIPGYSDRLCTSISTGDNLLWSGSSTIFNSVDIPSTYTSSVLLPVGNTISDVDSSTQTATFTFDKSPQELWPGLHTHASPDPLDPGDKYFINPPAGRDIYGMTTLEALELVSGNRSYYSDLILPSDFKMLMVLLKHPYTALHGATTNVGDQQVYTVRTCGQLVYGGPVYPPIPESTIFGDPLTATLSVKVGGIVRASKTFYFRHESSGVGVCAQDVDEPDSADFGTRLYSTHPTLDTWRKIAYATGDRICFYNSAIKTWQILEAVQPMSAGQKHPVPLPSDWVYPNAPPADTDWGALHTSWWTHIEDYDPDPDKSLHYGGLEFACRWKEMKKSWISLKSSSLTTPKVTFIAMVSVRSTIGSDMTFPDEGELSIQIDYDDLIPNMHDTVYFPEVGFRMINI